MIVSESGGFWNSSHILWNRLHWLHLSAQSRTDAVKSLKNLRLRERFPFHVSAFLAHGWSAHERNWRVRSKPRLKWNICENLVAIDESAYVRGNLQEFLSGKQSDSWTKAFKYSEQSDVFPHVFQVGLKGSVGLRPSLAALWWSSAVRRPFLSIPPRKGVEVAAPCGLACKHDPQGYHCNMLIGRFHACSGDQSNQSTAEMDVSLEEMWYIWPCVLLCQQWSGLEASRTFHPPFQHWYLCSQP